MRKNVSSGSLAAAVALILSLNVSTANVQVSAHIELPAQPLSEAIRAVTLGHPSAFRAKAELIADRFTW